MKFKRGDIVEFHNSIKEWLVVDYVENSSLYYFSSSMFSV